MKTMLVHQIQKKEELKNIRNIIRNNWKPLLNSMSIWSWKFDNSKFSLSGIVMIIGFVGNILYKFFGLMFVLIWRDNLLNVFFSLSLLFVTIITMIIFYRFQLKKEKILICLIKIFKISNGRNWKYFLLIRVMSIWINFVLFNVLIIVIFTFCNDDQFNYTWILRADFAKDHSETFKRGISCFYESMRSVFVMMPLNFSLILFVVICKEIEYAFQYLHTKSCNVTVISMETTPIIKMYLELMEIANEIEDIFSPVLFLFSVCVGTYIMLELSVIITITMKLLNIINFICFSCFPLCMFCDVCVSSSKVTESATKLGRRFYSLSVYSNDILTKLECFQFFVKSTQDLPYFSAWNIFPINNSLLLTVFSVALTYTLVIYQFKSGD